MTEKSVTADTTKRGRKPKNSLQEIPEVEIKADADVVEEETPEVDPPASPPLNQDPSQNPLDPQPKEPLKAYGPDGSIIGVSYDGGHEWSTKTPKESEQKMREYTMRIGAIVPEHPNLFERRVIAGFGDLYRVNILAGWGSETNFEELGEPVDGLVVGFTPEMDFDHLRQYGHIIYLYLEPKDFEREIRDNLVVAMQAADALLLPNDKMGMLLRKYNHRVYPYGGSIVPNMWRNIGRNAPSEKLTVAIQPTSNPFIRDAVEYVDSQYPGRMTVIGDNWMERSFYDDPEFYMGVDIVCIGQQDTDHLTNNVSLLSPMQAGCAIIAEACFHRSIIHGHSGALVAAKGPSGWRKEVLHQVTDTRYRTKLQRGARERSKYFTNKSLLHQFAIPFRTLIGQDQR